MTTRRNPALDEARHTFYKATDNMETGFITFEYKKQLWELKWFVDEALEKCSTYAGEEEWIQEKQVELAFARISKSG